MAANYRILAREILWTEKSGRIQSMGVTKKSGTTYLLNNNIFINTQVGNSQVVQWLGLHAFTSSTQVQSLIGELRSCKLWGAAGEKKERTLSCFPGQCDHECDEVILGRCQKHWWMFSLAVSRCQNTELPACWCLQGVPQKESKVFVSWSATSSPAHFVSDIWWGSIGW